VRRVMGRRGITEAPADWQVRVGHEELGRIFHLRDSLDQSEELIQHVGRYQELGWLLEAQGPEASTLDFSLPSESWAERLMTLSLAAVPVDVGVKTGLAAQLLVVEVRRGEIALDRYGKWRSPCRAQTTDGWEQHYYALSPEVRIPATGEDIDIQVRIYGQGGLALAPPSRRAVNAAVWTWLVPPWEVPPAPPGPPVWRFLENCGLLPETAGTAPDLDILPWDQIYAVIAPHEGLIRALMTPTASVKDYYQNLAQTALEVGLRDQSLLLALLWHAPRGDARTSLGRLAYLRELVATVIHEKKKKRKGFSQPGPLPPPAKEKAVSAKCSSATATRPPMDDLVGFMENRVILDRSRYENMIYELAELSAKAEALERRLEDYKQHLGVGQPIPAAQPEDSLEGSSNPQGFLSDYPAAVMPLKRGKQSLSSLKAIVQDFLKRNEDLATHPNSVQMLQFCLKNYIDLNPELNGLPLREKLEMAGKMAREFLNRVGEVRS